MTGTHRRAHLYLAFDNPYLRCGQCGGPVVGWHDPEKCGCGTLGVNAPCCCRSGVTSLCPSWGPVGGCCCQEVAGRVDHPAAPGEGS